MSHKVFVSTYPFGSVDTSPLDLLKDNGFEVFLNPLERKLSEIEVADLYHSKQAEYLIAGTEKIQDLFFKKNKPLAISRVGVGFDAIDLPLCEKWEVPVFYTPNAPRQAVVDQAIASIAHFGQELAVHFGNMRNRVWNRRVRRGFPDLAVGIIGFGRIGSSLAHGLRGLGCTEILVSEIDPSKAIPSFCRRVEIDELFGSSDVICLHASRELGCDDFIGQTLLRSMKPDSCFINLARGELVDEKALEEVLRSRIDVSAYIDVFKDEPYTGPLTQLDNCFCTSHLGSMTPSSRLSMEYDAAANLVSFVSRGAVCEENVVFMP